MKRENATSPKISISVKLIMRQLVLFLLVAVLAFGLGRLSVIESEKDPVSIDFDFGVLPESMRGETISFKEEIDEGKGAVVGSKNSDIYHLPWCPGAQRINDENKVWFESRTAAEEAGYTPARNCKGL